MKKIVILVENFRVGGGQYMVYELIKNLDPNRVKFKVLCYTPKKGTSLEKAMEKITDVEYLDIRGRVGPLEYLKVFKAINAHNPDLVHAHLSAQIFSIVWGCLYKKPTLITGHTIPEKAFLKKTRGILRYGLKRGKHHLVGVSDTLHSSTKKYFGIDDTRCFCVNNGIDIEAYPRKQHEHFTFINVATHNENKNQIALLNCFVRLLADNSDLRLILAGDGPTHDMLVGRAKELGVEDRVQFPGSVTDVASYLAVSDAYVQPSYREAMPLSVLEAMAAGLPIIATNVGGHPDIVKNNGYLVDVNEDAIFDAMKKILTISEEERERMQDASREIVKKFSSPEMARKYMEIYEKIC